MCRTGHSFYPLQVDAMSLSQSIELQNISKICFCFSLTKPIKFQVMFNKWIQYTFGRRGKRAAKNITSHNQWTNEKRKLSFPTSHFSFIFIHLFICFIFSIHSNVINSVPVPIPKNAEVNVKNFDYEFMGDIRQHLHGSNSRVPYHISQNDSSFVQNALNSACLLSDWEREKKENVEGSEARSAMSGAPFCFLRLLHFHTFLCIRDILLKSI